MGNSFPNHHCDREHATQAPLHQRHTGAFVSRLERCHEAHHDCTYVLVSCHAKELLIGSLDSIVTSYTCSTWTRVAGAVKGILEFFVGEPQLLKWENCDKGKYTGAFFAAGRSETTTLRFTSFRCCRIHLAESCLFFTYLEYLEGEGCSHSALMFSVPGTHGLASGWKRRHLDQATKASTSTP